MITAPLHVVTGISGVILIGACGWALSTFVPLLRAKRALLRLAWSYLLGAAFTGTALYALSHWGGVALRRGTILPVFLVPIASAFWQRRRVDGRLPHMRPFPLPARVACAAAAARGLERSKRFAHLVRSGNETLDDC